MTPLKLHKTLIEAVVQNLSYIFYENKYVDKVIERSLRSNPKWGSRDRAFIAETTYDIVRWWRLYQYCLYGSEEMRMPKLFEMYRIIAVHLLLNNIDLPDWKEFDGVDAKKIIYFSNQAKNIRKIKNSIPDWLDELGFISLGEKWDNEMAALNQPAPLVLRVNALKTDKASLQKIFNDKKIKASFIPGHKDALLIYNRQNLFNHEEFKDGLFEVQDASSQLVAEMLQVLPGMRVIDACAGAGGKTLHLAALMQNKGRIISMDTEQWKLDELKKRARRAGVNNLETRLIEGAKSIKKSEASAERLLLDVPCSGLGVMKRNPDAKWKLQNDFIEKIKRVQADILEQYAVMLKPGGHMVYATCSILPAENNLQVAAFLDKNKNFILEEEKHIFPAESGFDGFYMARLKKND